SYEEDEKDEVQDNNNINIIEYGDIIGESSNFECQHDWVRGKETMKKEKNFNGTESYVFSPDNKLRIFPPSAFKFKQKNHIVLNDECILDNFWHQYNNQKEKMGYFLSIFNSLAKYFKIINTTQTKSYQVPKNHQNKSHYISYIKAQNSSSKPSYKQVLQKNINPIDKEYLEWKMIELLEQIGPQWKKDIKEEI
ncbi:LOW QUALITY PROTEIN: hypothetical protein U9M48_008246, partial [Paspalum notatum var. saurae]